MSNLDSKRLKELLDYNPKTGIFTWKQSKYQPYRIGTVAGCKNKSGYIVINIGKLYYAHRLAWLYVYEYWPESIIDHINMIKNDNRIENLRCVTISQNAQNRKTQGFTKPKQTKKWSSSITVNRVRKHIGYFDTPELAHQAYIEAKKIFHTI